MLQNGSLCLCFHCKSPHMYCCSIINMLSQLSKCNLYNTSNKNVGNTSVWCVILWVAGRYFNYVIYSDREKNRKSCRIVTINGNETALVNPADNQAKKFKFDHSYWSHDGYVVRKDGYYAPGDGTGYVDQVCVADYVHFRCIF